MQRGPISKKKEDDSRSANSSQKKGEGGLEDDLEGEVRIQEKKNSQLFHTGAGKKASVAA